MYIQKGGGFDGGFTELQTWSLTDYDRVLVLDVDIIPLQLTELIFETDCPAAARLNWGMAKKCTILP